VKEKRKCALCRKPFIGTGRRIEIPAFEGRAKQTQRWCTWCWSSTLDLRREARVNPKVWDFLLRSKAPVVG
jgi:hypothetical protein